MNPSARNTVISTDASAALALRDFSYRYPGGDSEGLRSVSLEIPRGEFVLVCGRSGSGKSTLLRTAGGLVPHHFGGVAGGEGTICGLDLRGNGPAELARCCGTVMQDPEVQIVMGSVRHEIAFPLENLGFDPLQTRIAVEETALALGIDRLLDRRTGELSGGEMQRVVLAAALAAQPPLLVLDEPTSQLDPVAADELLFTLSRLNTDRGTTVMLADHRIARVLPYADRVLVVDGGVVVCDSDPAGFLDWAAADPRHEWLLPPAAKLFSLTGLSPLPIDLKQARRELGERQLLAHQRVGSDRELAARATPSPRTISTPSRNQADSVLSLRNLNYAYSKHAAPAISGIDIEVRAGERIALMGANGSGKSTLLRLMRGLLQPNAGRVAASGEIGLLLQNPNDYLIHERVTDEAPTDSLERFGLADFADRDPRDLSGGERQRLALAIVMQGDPVALLLDEPTRGMDPLLKTDLAALLNDLAASGTAVVLATHDAEFAAEVAERVLMLERGELIADACARELLGGGRHFATETAKLLGDPRALTPQAGAALLSSGGRTASTSSKPSASVQRRSIDPPSASEAR